MVVAMLIGKIYRGLGEIEKSRSIYQKALELAVSQKHEGPEAEIRAILEDL